MKRIFTLLFFVGFLTSAFAQQARRRQSDNQANNYTNQSSQYADDYNYAYSKSYNDHKGYNKNDQLNKRNHENDYGYNKRRDYRDRRDNWNNQYSQPECVTPKRIDDSYSNRRRVPLIKILFNISGIFQ